jgi:hypothetical protein
MLARLLGGTRAVVAGDTMVVAFSFTIVGAHVLARVFG